MKTLKKGILAGAILLFFLHTLCDALPEKHIVLVVCSYNNKDWYRRNLDSVLSQRYENFHVIYVNDASSDETGALVGEYIKEKGAESRIILINNKERQGAMANQYHAISSCKDTDIIGILDGDDWLAHEGVLAFLNTIYADGTVWLTYGQFVEYPHGARGFCHQMPTDIIMQNAFRCYQDIPSHMRTFYAGLFKRIKIDDLYYNGDFLPMCADMAAMIPMIEMARDHFRFIPDVLYIYNSANCLNDHKVSQRLQKGMDNYIRSKPRYDKVVSPW